MKKHEFKQDMEKFTAVKTSLTDMLGSTRNPFGEEDRYTSELVTFLGKANKFGLKVLNHSPQQISFTAKVKNSFNNLSTNVHGMVNNYKEKGIDLYTKYIKTS